MKKPTNHIRPEITPSCNNTMTFIYSLLNTCNVPDTISDIKRAMLKRPYLT